MSQPYAAAIDSYNKAIEIRQQLLIDVSEYQNDLADAYNNRGVDQTNSHDYTAAINSYNKANVEPS